MVDGAQLITDLDNIRHMLGVGEHIPKREWCYRNYYNANDGDQSMERLQRLGYVEQYRSNYWRATESGCKAIGLTAKQIQRALHGD